VTARTTTAAQCEPGAEGVEIERGVACKGVRDRPESSVSRMGPGGASTRPSGDPTHHGRRSARTRDPKASEAGAEKEARLRKNAPIRFWRKASNRGACGSVLLLTRAYSEHVRVNAIEGKGNARELKKDLGDRGPSRPPRIA
jgi:hypothetical protein